MGSEFLSSNLHGVKGNKALVCVALRYPEASRRLHCLLNSSLGLIDKRS